MTGILEIGRLLITPTAEAALEGADLVEALQRHAMGDRGDFCEESFLGNELSVNEGFRLLSAHADRKGVKLWTIT